METFVQDRKRMEELIQMDSQRPPDTYRNLYREGRLLYNASRFGDAATLFRRAMEVQDTSAPKDIHAKFWLGNSLKLIGDYREAIVCLGEVYVDCKDDPGDSYYAMHSLAWIINCFLNLYNVDEAYCDLEEVLALSERVLEEIALRDMNHIRSTLLLDRATMLTLLGRHEEALGEAEEAYLAKKRYISGYYQGAYLRIIAHNARKLGDVNRAREVLDEYNSFRNDAYTSIFVLAEKIRLAHAVAPSDLPQAVNDARCMRILGRDVQSHKAIRENYGDAGYTFVAAGLLPEAYGTFRTLGDAWKEPPLQRTYLRREADALITRTLDVLGTPDNETARELSGYLSGLGREIHDLLRVDEAFQPLSRVLLLKI